jgi:hypothetical protein
MDGTGIALVLFTLLGLMVFGALCCCGFCCLCCAFPIFSIISGMFSKSPCCMPWLSHNRRGGEYEMVRDGGEFTPYHQTAEGYAEGYEPSAPPLYENLEPIAEAYIVPPLVEVQAMQAEAVALERGAPISQVCVCVCMCVCVCVCVCFGHL